MVHTAEPQHEQDRSCGEVKIATAAALDEFVSRFGSSDASREPLPATRMIPLGDSPLLRGFRVKGLLSEEECAYLRQHVGYAESLDIVNNGGQTYRRNLRTQLAHEGLASLLYARMDKLLPGEHVVPEGETEFGPEAVGKWKRVSLNTSFRFCKYGADGVFLPHFDGVFIKNPRERSLWTLMVYLNPATKFEGGATNFLDSSAPDFVPGQAKPCPVLASVLPEEGEVLLFPVDMYHEGQSLTGGEKYILRTDVMFERADAPVLTPNQEKAQEALNMAREHERQGNAAEAVACYRRAIKLDRSIEKLL